MLLYIRHAKDKEDKDGNDGSLRKSSKMEIKKQTLLWIEKYGLPDVVYYSPFYRTFQTVKQIKRTLEKHMEENKITKIIKYVVEPKIGRYVTKKEMNVRENTLKKGAIVGETTEQFKQRIKDHYDSLKKILKTEKTEKTQKTEKTEKIEKIEKTQKTEKTQDIENENLKIWNVTHAYILSITATYANILLKEHLEYLDTLVIQ